MDDDLKRKTPSKIFLELFQGLGHPPRWGVCPFLEKKSVKQSGAESKKKCILVLKIEIAQLCY